MEELREDYVMKRTCEEMFELYDSILWGKFEKSDYSTFKRIVTKAFQLGTIHEVLTSTVTGYFGTVKFGRAKEGVEFVDKIIIDDKGINIFCNDKVTTIEKNDIFRITQDVSESEDEKIIAMYIMGEKHHMMVIHFEE